MLNNTSIKAIGLMISPGILMFLQRSKIMEFAPFAFIPILIIIMITIVIWDITICGKLEIWHLPSIGLFFWEIYYTISWFFGNKGLLSLLDIFFGISSIVCIIIIVRRRIQFTKFALVPIIFLIAVLGLSALNYSENQMSIFLVWLIDWLIKVIPFIVAGYIFSKWQGANAILLNIACIPFWLEMYVMPDGISIEIINSQNQQVHFALGLFKILPSLGFLIIIPLVSMFLSKNRSIKFWVAISSFLIISFLCLLYAIFIRNPNAVFVFSKFTTWIFFTTILWMPILLGIIIYSDNNFG